MKNIVSRLVILLPVLLLASFFNGCQSTYVRSAKIYMQQDDPENAKEQLLEGAKYTPNDPELFYILGKVNAELEAWEEMCQAFDRTEELTDKYNEDIKSTRLETWRTVFNSSVDPFNESEYEEALKIFQIALMIRPGEEETLKRIGLCYLQLGDFKNAEDFLKQSLAKDVEKKDLSSRINLLNIFSQQDRWDEVISMADEILKLHQQLGNPETGGTGLDKTKYINVVSRKAIAYQRKEMKDEAIAAWDTAIAGDPGNSDFYYNKALLLHGMERWADAASCYYKVIELNPNDDEARKNAARAFLAAKDWEMLVKILEPWLFNGGEVKEIEPTITDSNSWLILNAAYQNLGMMDKSTIIAKILNKIK